MKSSLYWIVVDVLLLVDALFPAEIILTGKTAFVAHTSENELRKRDSADNCCLIQVVQRQHSLNARSHVS